MAKRVEMERAPHGLARLKTYVNGNLTHVTEAIPIGAARNALERHRDAGLETVDHTTDIGEEA